ncbi:MAG: EamA family transporter [Cyanobacteria bacterium J06635_13]
MQLSSKSTPSFVQALMLIAPFFLWGTAMVAMKGVIPQTTPFFMAGVRLLPAGILVLLVSVILKLPQPKTWQAWLWILAFAVVDGTMFQGFLALGIVRTGAGLGSVMIDSQPLAVALLSSFLFGEVIGLWGWLGLFDNGEWLMLLASLSMALGTVMISFVSRHADPVVATGWHMIIGGVPLFTLSYLQESQQWQHISLEGWLGLGYATVFGSAIAYGIFFYLASKGNLTSLSALTFLTPIFALLFGTIILSEVLSGLQSVGVGLTLVSIYLINQRDNLAARFSQQTNSLETSSAVKEQAKITINKVATTITEEVAVEEN